MKVIQTALAAIENVTNCYLNVEFEFLNFHQSVRVINVLFTW